MPFLAFSVVIVSSSKALKKKTTKTSVYKDICIFGHLRQFLLRGPWFIEFYGSFEAHSHIYNEVWVEGL